MAPLIDAVTQHYKTPIGEMRLRPLQALALKEFHDFGGAFGALPAGGGKTLISALAPRVVDGARAAIFVPASLVEKTAKEFAQYARHFRIAPVYEIFSYERQQTEGNENLLYDYAPDVVVLDEVHFVRDPSAKRTRIIMRFFKDHPAVRLMALSASVTSKSIKDYAHILAITHGTVRSPLPVSYRSLNVWADALDADVPDHRRVQPGALLELCREGELPRHGFRRRLVDTPGVVTSTQTAFEDSPAPRLLIHDMPVTTVPQPIVDAFRLMRTEFKTLGGDEIADGKAQWRHANTLAFGFYTRWVWPRNEPDHEWLNTRKDWKSQVRKTIIASARSLTPFDSEGTVRRACEEGALDHVSTREDVMNAYAAWFAIKERYGKYGPPVETVWFTHDMLELVARQCEYVASGGATIVWVRNPSMGELLARRLGWKYFGAGAEGIEDHRRPCVASIQSHGTGRNLQHYYWRNVYVARPFNGAHWEQVLCRTWRPGQQSPLVENFVYNHCREMWEVLERSREHAAYIEDTIWNPQALLRAEYTSQLNATAVLNLEQSDNPLWTKTPLKLPKGDDAEGGSL